MNITMTRKDYMKPRDCEGKTMEEKRQIGHEVHQKYHSQFDHPAIRAAIIRKFGLDNLVKSYNEDVYMNGKLTPIKEWDRIAHCIPQSVVMAMRASNATTYKEGTIDGGFSLSDAISIMKATAVAMVMESKVSTEGNQ